MKNKKEKLTARQRKELQKSKSGTKKQNEADVNTAGGETILGIKKKNFFFILLAILLAGVIITLAIVLPLFFEPYGEYENPVAVINLSDGTKLEYQIYENDFPYASTNFIYLAKKGYFDGSIVYDIQNGYMRFGGFKDELFDVKTSHISTDEDFLSKLTDITVPSEPSTRTKMFYRIKQDSSIKGKDYTAQGVLSFMQNTSSGEFQICGASSGGALESQNDNGTSTKKYNTAIPFATYLNIETLNRIVALYDNNETDRRLPPPNQNYYWLPKNTITIKSVKVYNLDASKWKNFNYDEYLTTDKHLSYWAYNAYGN